MQDIDRPISFGAFMSVIRPNPGVLESYLLRCLRTEFASDFFLRNANTTTNISNLNLSTLAELQIPLPPLDVQKEIVAEIVGYQRVIDGARMVVDNYRPHIAVDPKWPLVAIGDICDLVNGRAFKPEDWQDSESGGLPIVRIQNLNNSSGGFNYYTGQVKDKYIINDGQLLFSWSGSKGTSFGAHIWNGGKAILNQHIFKVGFDKELVTKMYLFNALNEAVVQVEENLHGGVGLVHITKGNLEKVQIPLPPLGVQQGIAAEIEAEQALVDANRKLVERMEERLRRPSRGCGRSQPDDRFRAAMIRPTPPVPTF